MRTRRTVGLLAAAVVLLASCTSESAVESSTTALVNDPNESFDYSNAISVIVSIDPPIRVEAVDEFASIGGPGLGPMIAYYYVPSGGADSTGLFGLDQGADYAIGFVEQRFEREGLFGFDELLVYGIGFIPAGSKDMVNAAARRFTQQGSTVTECAIHVNRGGCPQQPPGVPLG